MNFDQLFKSFANLKVVVFGDVMLDTYWWGHVERISPEAPVPVVALKNKELRIGGAGNVALNTVALGAQTFVVSAIGIDDDGKQLRDLFEKNNINTDFLIESSKRITTNKVRIISRNQHMMRLDAEITKDVDADIENKLLSSLKSCFENTKPDVLIFEDYNKGVLTANLIEKVIELCKIHQVVTTVDPKRKN
ncbi:MAG: carbohydrate kinase, partial [Bacteroidota bacterium]|nr:carbohydrate kinase [Bacteroidota bacterium]